MQSGKSTLIKYKLVPTAFGRLLLLSVRHLVTVIKLFV